MKNQVLRIESVKLVGPHALLLIFNDGKTRRVNLFPVLTGPIFRPLRDAAFFSRVTLDPVAGTVVWPNGADFAPDYLRELPELVKTRRTGRKTHAALPRVGHGAPGGASPACKTGKRAFVVGVHEETGNR